jgi:hypothetical protein
MYLHKAWDYGLTMAFRGSGSEFYNWVKGVANYFSCYVAFMVFLYQYAMLNFNSCMASACSLCACSY